MAILTPATTSRSGRNLSTSSSAAASGGDKIKNSGKEYLYVHNGSASAVTVTLDIKATLDGQGVTDPTVSVPAGESMLIGPFPPKWYNDSDGFVNFTYSAVTSVKVLALYF